MSERIHSLSANKQPHGNLFEPCQEELLTYLRKQHALFINSDHFYNVSIILSLQKLIKWNITVLGVITMPIILSGSKMINW